MENKIEFSKGDTVRVNSGGPLMTVSNVLSNNQLECIWFNDDDDAEWIELDDEDLEEVEEEKEEFTANN